MDSDLIQMNATTQNKNFSLKEAKDYFEMQTERYAISTRSGKESKSARLSPGDFAPKWEKSVNSSSKQLISYDIPIESSIRYKAMVSKYENGKASANVVDVYQKLIIVKDTKSGDLGQYILTLIPDREYYAKYKKEVCNQFINCSDKGKFSGVAIYTVPNLNMIIRASRYVNGVKTQGVFLPDKSKKMKQKIKCLRSILKEVVLSQNIVVSTRSFGEDDDWDWGWDDNDWDYGDENINYWDIGNDFYYDKANDQVLYDYDKDGYPDSMWIPDVEVTPDDPWGNPDPDPAPDPEPEDELDGCIYCGSIGCGGECQDDESTIPDTPNYNKISQETMKKTAKSVVKDVISKFGSTKAYCNMGVHGMFKSLFNSNDLSGKNANTMVKYWKDNPDKWEKITMSQAQKLANDGYFVVAGWINPTTGRSGHVVVIVPGTETHSGSWGKVPNSMDTGYKMRTESQPLSQSFGKDKKDSTIFFKYK